MKFTEILFVTLLTAFPSTSNAFVSIQTPTQSTIATNSRIYAATEPAVVAENGAAVDSSSASMGGSAISGLTSSLKTVFTSEQIDAILPHRYPFALVDKVVEYEAGKRAVGIKSVTKVCS